MAPRMLNAQNLRGLRYILPILPLLARGVVAAPPTSVEKKYDYVVVGSGPGGGTLAGNLARANYSVLLIEAGDESEVTVQDDPAATWDFFVEHYEDRAKTLKNNRVTWKTKEGRYWVGPGSSTPPQGSQYLGIYYPRGATLGGSSMINAMATLLPSDSEWDYIANLTGDGSWGAGNMRKIFERIEHNNYLPKGTPGHGFDGYFQTNMDSTAIPGEPVISVAKAMANSLGIDTAGVSFQFGADPNLLDPKKDQVPSIHGIPKHTSKDGKRFSSRHYVQDTVKAGFPLTVSTHSLATSILIGKPVGAACKPKAVGVTFLRGQSLYQADQRYSSNSNRPPPPKETAYASREVIVSGGAFNTPQLLKLSGIGPATELARHGIPLVADVPGVGENLMDNPEMPVVGVGRTGAAPGPMSGVQFRTPHAPGRDRDIFVMHGARALRGFWPPNQTNTAMAPADAPGTYGVGIVKQFPGSGRGRVLLRGADPTAPPGVVFNHYAGAGGAADVEAMKDVVRWARGVFARVDAPFGPVRPTEPPCGGPPDEDFACAEDEDWVRGQTYGHHPTSSCRIGAADDGMAVLDSRFRVRGVQGLRVVDASALPRTPGAFPVVSVFMISQKAADVILEEAKGLGKESAC